MRLVGFVMLHLACQSKLGQLLPVTSALVGHCPLSAAPSSLGRSTSPVLIVSIIIADTSKAPLQKTLLSFHRTADIFCVCYEAKCSNSSGEVC